MPQPRLWAQSNGLNLFAEDYPYTRCSLNLHQYRQNSLLGSFARQQHTNGLFVIRMLQFSGQSTANCLVYSTDHERRDLTH